jgi:hypothetical protein
MWGTPHSVKNSADTFLIIRTFWQCLVDQNISWEQSRLKLADIVASNVLNEEQLKAEEKHVLHFTLRF